MENYRKSSDNEELNKEVPKKKLKLLKKNDGQDFFNTWAIRRDQENSNIEREEDEEELTENGEKPKNFNKRFRKLWHGFFELLSGSDLAPKPQKTKPTIETNKQETSELDNISAPETEVEPSAASRPNLESSWYENQPINPNDQSQATNLPASSFEQSGREIDNPPKQSEETSKSGEGRGNSGELPPPPNIAYRDGGAESSGPEPTENSTSTVTNRLEDHSHRPDWGPALVVGMYEGHLSRKRDRRLRKEVGSIKNTLNKDLTSPREQFGQNKNEYKSNNQTPELPNAPSKLNPEVSKPSVEQTHTNYREQAEMTPQSDKQVTPEVIFKEVAKAAEKNIPLEGLIERQHEIKDLPKDSSGSATTAYGSKDLNNSAFGQSASTSLSSKPNLFKRIILADDQQLKSLAAKGGAISIIIIATILIFLIY